MNPTRKCGVVLLAALLLGAVELLPADAASRSTAPQSIVLKLNDLPHGFQLRVSRAIDNTQASKQTKVNIAVLKKEGRLSAYETDFEKPLNGQAIPKGMVLLGNQVSAYKSATGATWHFNISSSNNTRVEAKKPKFAEATVPGLGDQSVLITYNEKAGSVTYSEAIIVFRRGPYAGSLFGLGLLGTWKSTDLVRLAKLVDARMRRAP